MSCSGICQSCSKRCVICRKYPELKVTLVLPNDSLLTLAKSAGIPEKVSPQVGRLAEALAAADVAIASTGTVLLECAVFGVPTVALYRTSWLTYQIGKRIVTVDFMAMPNLLSGRRIMPEFIQDDATTKNVAGAAWNCSRIRRTRGGAPGTGACGAVSRRLGREPPRGDGDSGALALSARLKVLMSAYACEPGKGSEPEVGWQWAMRMARFHDVTVLTRANNRAAIEPAVAAIPRANRFRNLSTTICHRSGPR